MIVNLKFQEKLCETNKNKPLTYNNLLSTPFFSVDNDLQLIIY